LTLTNDDRAADAMPDWDLETTGEESPSDAAFADRDTEIATPFHPMRSIDALRPLRQLRHWVIARQEVVNGRTTKVPYCAFDLTRKASSTDRSTWSDFETACRIVERDRSWMLGFVLHDSGYLGIDFDNCRNAQTGAIEAWASELSARVPTYTEASVSGTGIHQIVKGALPPGRRRTGSDGKCPAIPAGAEVEMYDSARYFIMTGDVLSGASRIESCTDAVAALHGCLFPAAASAPPAALASPTPNDLPDDELLKRARTAKKSGKKFTKLWDGDLSDHHGDASKADAALCAYLAFWTGNDPARIDQLFRQSKLYREKWDREDYRTRTIALAMQASAAYGPTPRRGVNADDFVAYLPQHSYIFTPTGELWPPASVNASVPAVKVTTLDGPGTMPASVWLDRHRAVEQMTWAPGFPAIIQNRLVSQGGWIERDGCNTFNLYRPPQIPHGDPSRATPWLDLLRTLYPEHVDHVVGWCAHRVQRPGDKPNHALLFGGPPGIGKDSWLEPLKHAVGPWNFQEASPANLFEPFNPYVKAVILRISEARDMGDVNRYGFHEHMKVLTAAPPDVLRVNEKNIREYAVVNVCGVIYTTNHRTDGLYLPADDRRHYVMWSERKPEHFASDYWNKLWSWYAAGGLGHVAAYLAAHDLSTFDAKAPPLKTPAFWDIVAANRAPENAELADALDALNNPAALTLDQLRKAGVGESLAFLNDRKFARQIPHRLHEVGYEQQRNDTAKDGLWKIDGRRQAVYVRQDLALHARHDAVKALIRIFDGQAHVDGAAI
jgi:hypothetical protein